MADVAQTTLAPVHANISLVEMFMQASLIVQVVMVGLLLASVWSWAIIFSKMFLFRRARRETDRFEQQFWSGQSLEELYGAISRGRTESMASLFVAAMREWKRSFQTAHASFVGLQARIEKVLDVSIAREVEKLESNLLVLATVASAAGKRRQVGSQESNHEPCADQEQCRHQHAIDRGDADARLPCQILDRRSPLHGSPCPADDIPQRRLEV